MNISSTKIFISESLGSVSAEIVKPESPWVVMTLAHGAGAGLSHPFMKNLSLALAEEKIATVRFNLHYMEHKKKRPDVPAIAHKVIEEVIAFTAQQFPGIPLIVSGKSFGGRMSSQLIAQKELTSVKGIVFYGFPLHPANQPGIERAEHLNSVKVPMLFLQGTKDTLARLSLMEAVTDKLTYATLSPIENADHSFKVGKKDSIVDLSRKTTNWIKEKLIHMG